jgi:hypothetical protein
LFFNKNS